MRVKYAVIFFILSANRYSAHGTGTRLGDAIELEAVRKVYDDVAREAPLWLSSSKTVFGHCQAASAFVGV